MSSRMITTTARSALPRDKSMRHDRREHDKTRYALFVGQAILEKLRERAVRTLNAKCLKRAIESFLLLREVAIGTEVMIKVISGEVHAFIYDQAKKKRKKDPAHGHVVVPIGGSSDAFYHRGYGMPHGAWNCSV